MKKQWQELKETIIEIRDSNKCNEYVSLLCGFLINYMSVLEKQMQELCEYAPFTIDELKDEDTQKLFRKFKNQRVIVTDNDCLPSATIIEPCKDCISRQAVLDYIRRILNQGTGKKKSFEFIQKYVANLPSVTPKGKTGHWILLDECSNSGYYCSKCNKKVVKEGWSNTVKKIKYCPNCGAKMVELQENEDKLVKDSINDVLDKIRAEIDGIEEGISSYYNDRPWLFKDEVLDIIDKYKAERNDKE